MRRGPDPGAILVLGSTLASALSASLVKSINVPPILLLQTRGFVLWLLSCSTALLGAHWQLLNSEALCVPRMHLIFGNPADRKILFLRAVIYTLFVLLYWTCLECLPQGDATAVTQTFVWTTFYATCLLREPLRAVIWPCILLHIGGILLIARPHFIFGSSMERSALEWQQRTEGVVAGFIAALLGGLQPVLMRICDRSHWVAVEHTNHAFQTFVAGPLLLLTFIYAEPALTDHRKEHYAAHFLAVFTPQTLPVLFLGIPLFAFLSFALYTRGMQITRSAGLAALMSPLEIPIANLLQAGLFGERTIDSVSMLGMTLILSAVFLNGAWQMRYQGDGFGKDEDSNGQAPGAGSDAATAEKGKRRDDDNAEVDYGELATFYGAFCTHFALENLTQVTRVSLDFRVVPGCCYEVGPEEEEGGFLARMEGRKWR